MVFVYGQAGGNDREAARMDRATYSDRKHHPNHATFGAIYRHLCEHEALECHFEQLCDMGGIQAMYCVPGLFV